jgi:hypothetical protein
MTGKNIFRQREQKRSACVEWVVALRATRKKKILRSANKVEPACVELVTREVETRGKRIPRRLPRRTNK